MFTLILKCKKRLNICFSDVSGALSRHIREWWVLFSTTSDIKEFGAQNRRLSCDCGNCHSSAIITLKSVSFTLASWLWNIQNMLLHSWLCSSSTEIVTVNLRRPRVPALYAAPWLTEGSFTRRKFSTCGQILLVSVPENVWSTPLHLEATKKTQKSVSLSVISRFQRWSRSWTASKNR